jgi:hypothetical protein
MKRHLPILIAFMLLGGSAVAHAQERKPATPQGKKTDVAAKDEAKQRRETAILTIARTVLKEKAVTGS